MMDPAISDYVEDSEEDLIPMVLDVLKHVIVKQPIRVENSRDPNPLEMCLDCFDENPSFMRFNPGIEADSTTPTQPCDPRYLQALINDIFYFTRLAAHKLNDSGLKAALPQHTDIVIKNLLAVMDECLRLKAVPDLFPSVAMKYDFLKKLGKVLPLMIIAKKLAKSSNRLHHPMRTFNNIPVPIKRPKFHPDRYRRTKPWNKWLNNSARFNYKWMAIQQKIPRYGDRLMRKITLEYDAIEANFTANEFVVQNPETDSIQPPGNDFQHMVWSGFATIPVYDLGFESGCSKTYDANGVVRLENLCNRLTTLDGVQPVLESSNCPYFRFAMATTR